MRDIDDDGVGLGCGRGLDGICRCLEREEFVLVRELSGKNDERC